MRVVLVTAPTKHELGQLRHVDLLAMAIRAQVAANETQVLRIAALSKDQIVALLAPQRKRGAGDGLG